MGFLSSLFGRNKAQAELKGVVDHIHRLLEDEELQLQMVHPLMLDTLKNSPAYDRDPNGAGPFGFSEHNPIPVNGPIGELAYLSKLETLAGERVLFHRIGSIDLIDVFEAVTFSGSDWFIFFLDFYHPRRSRLTPEGFRFTQQVPQFTGFHNACPNFPYDFPEMKAGEDESGLSLAYIALGRVTPQIEAKVFARPLAHKSKIDSVRRRLTSFRAM